MAIYTQNTCDIISVTFSRLQYNTPYLGGIEKGPEKGHVLSSTTIVVCNSLLFVVGIVQSKIPSQQVINTCCYSFSCQSACNILDYLLIYNDQKLLDIAFIWSH